MAYTRLPSSFLLWLSLSLYLAALPLHGEELKWSGFFTTGAVFSDSPYSYNRGITKKPKITEETMLGLNLSRQLDDDWRAAAQFLAHAAEADAAVKADWAFINYQPHNWFSLKLGKQTIPIWLMSEYIDVGFVYPWFKPPTEVYSLFNLKSFVGASSRQELAMDSFILGLEIYGGDILLEAAPNSPSAISKIKGENVFGGRMDINFGNIAINAAFNRAVWDLNLNDQLRFGQREYEIISFGIKANFANALLISEYAETKDLDQDTYLKKANNLQTSAAEAAKAGNEAEAQRLGTQAIILKTKLGGAKAFYVTGGYDFHDSRLHLTYANLKKPFQENVTRDQTSVTLGLNHNLTSYSVVKLEVGRVRVPEGSLGLLDDNPRKSDDEIIEVNVYTLGYHLIY